MYSPRYMQLLKELAQGFEEGTDRLLDADWLVHNDITAADNMALSEAVGVILRGFVRAPLKTQFLVGLLGIDKEETLPPVVVELGVAQGQSMRQIREYVDRLDKEDKSGQ